MINWNNWAEEGIVTELVIDNFVEFNLSSLISAQANKGKLWRIEKGFINFANLG